MKQSRLIVLAVACAFFSSMLTAQRMPLSQIRQLPERKTSFYTTVLAANVGDKLQAAPAQVIQYLCAMDNVTNYENHELTHSERELFLEYYSYLPKEFQDQISRKVLAIYVIDGFSFGGMADYAFDEQGEMYSILYLNAKLFSVGLSDWLTARDNSPFENKDSKKSIAANCGSGYKGLLHTLVHEACHVYDYHNHVTPYTEPSLIETGTAGTKFVDVWDDYVTPLRAYRNKDVWKINYWGFGEKTGIDTVKKLIDYLNKSPFSSIYGAKNWADDYAETFTYFYLKEKFNIEYELSYKENGVTKKSYIPTNNPLARERYGFLKFAE